MRTQNYDEFDQIQMGKEEVVRVLVEYGGDPFLASGKGRLNFIVETLLPIVG